MVKIRKGENMNWWRTLVNWLKTKNRLIKENEELLEALDKSAVLIQSMHTTLKYNVLEAEQAIQNIRREAIILLGGVALQYQGEVCVKNEFMEMITLPQYNLEVSVKRDDEKKCTVISAIESPKTEEELKDVEDK
jgi:hypothetical protein